MVIFKYELRQSARYITGWAVALAASIFCMIPVYYGFMGAAGTAAGPLFETIGKSDFFKSVGLSMSFLSEPLGIYAFLTSFFMIASGIFGMHFGLSIHTKECSGKTAEYLFTKPYPRRSIFLAKAAAVACGEAVVCGGYVLFSLASLALFQPGFSLGQFFLIACSLWIVTLFFSAAGLLVGILFSKNRSPLLTAGIVIFTEYCITSFSRVTGLRPLSFLSPYSYFSASEIARTGCYEWPYLLCCVLLMAVFSVTAYGVFLRKDIQFRT